MTTSMIFDSYDSDLLSRLGISSADIPMEVALQEGGIYVLLFRLRLHREVLFHWGIYLHQRTITRLDERGVITYDLYGSWYHITDLSGEWRADHAMTTGVLRSTALVILARLGCLTPTSHSRFDAVIRQQDSSLNTVGRMTCRIWTMRAIADLCNAGLLTLKSGFSYENVENELKTEATRALERAVPSVVGLWSFGTKPR